jgi:cobalt-zinc-cadmium efflux system outer membrane protein
MKFLLVMLGSIVLLTQGVYAQKADSLKLTLPEAEQQFTQKNFFLLAQKYNIEASKAAIIQANLLPNPTVNLEQTVITKSTIANDAPIGPLGQRAIQIQQLIQVAGKRNKQVALAKIGVEISEFQFSEIIRELLFQLRGSFYQIHFLEKTLVMYDQEIQNIRLGGGVPRASSKGKFTAKRTDSFAIFLDYFTNRGKRY